MPKLLIFLCVAEGRFACINAYGVYMLELLHCPFAYSIRVIARGNQMVAS